MLEAKRVSKTYKSGHGRVDAVRRVDLRVRESEFVVIEGVSGSGKSTLLYLLGGLLRPTSGTVLLQGADLAHLDEGARTRLRRDRVGFVFQSFNLVETLSAHDNVELAMVPTGLASAERRRRATELLDMVGMAHRAKHVPAKLSGGEQQRVAIARALANGPAVVLADEPTGDLDSATGASIIRMLKELTEGSQTSVVVVTHAPYVAEHATSLYRMSDGSLHEVD